MPDRPLRKLRAFAQNAVRHGLAAALLLALARAASAQALETDRIDITGRQNLTLGSGARAYGMGGAFLARADDATAASWNPAGLSYLRLPEVSLVGVVNSFRIQKPIAVDKQSDEKFNGNALDFAAFTWPVGIGEVRGAVQLSYQRAISFDGTRELTDYAVSTGQLQRTDTGRSNGGFDVVALGTGLRVTRGLRAGFTVNRWFNGYEQTLSRTVLQDYQLHPQRQFSLDFRPRGWNVNLGLMWSPIEVLNVGAVFKTPFQARVRLDKSRSDSWGALGTTWVVTDNAFSSRTVRLDFPASYGVGASWRPRDTLTLSADVTRTRWAEARILDYFDIAATKPPGEDGVPNPKPAPTISPVLQYPSLLPVPPEDPTDPALPAAQRAAQRDKYELRVGVEWVLIERSLKIPLRAGYFSDRQIMPDSATGYTPRYDGFTAGLGISLGPVLLDVAWIHEFGSDSFAPPGSPADFALDSEAPAPAPPLRNALTTNRAFASVIYRFSGHH